MRDAEPGETTEPGETAESDDGSRWSLLGVGGALSLCCLFTAPVATGGASGVTAGGATAALGATLLQIAVAALAVGVAGAALRWRSGSRSCDA